MQNGQKANIPLDSGLDVKSSDMLVPVDRPLFHHNRQKYQGRYLPSSVRFEHDGWAAGHDVYEFDVAEAQVQVDDITIIRKTLNDNPAYEVRLLDMDRNILGTLVYNADGRIKDYTVDSCEIAGGHVTGLFNNKPFDLLYDRNDINAVPVQQVPDSDIQLDEFEKLSEYASRIKLYDEKARIELTFAGMYLPSDKIYNGDYLFGKFVQYLGGVSSWQCGSYTFSITYDDVHDTYGMSLVDRNNNPVTIEPGASVTPVPDSNDVDVSFTADIASPVSMPASWQKVFPFLKHISVTSPGNKITFAFDADEDNYINRWGFNMMNVPADGTVVPSDNEGIWYRNFFNGHTDFNSKYVKHKFAVWFGYSGAQLVPRFVDNVPTAEYNNDFFLYTLGGIVGVLHANLTEGMSTGKEHSIFMYKNFGDYPATYLDCALWKGTERYKLKPNDVIIQQGTSGIGGIALTGKFKVKSSGSSTYTEYGFDGGIDVGFFDSKLLYLPFLDNPSDYDAIRDFFTLETYNWAATGSEVDMYVSEIAIHITGALQSHGLIDTNYFESWDGEARDGWFHTTIRFTFDQDKTSVSSHRYRLGNITNVSKTMGFDTFPRMKNQLFAANLTYEGKMYYAACAMGTLISKVNIAKDAYLTDKVDSSWFEINPAPAAAYSSDDINISDIFMHRLGDVSCDDKFELGIQLCAVNQLQYLYYTGKSDDQSSSNQVTIDDIPGHIRYDTLDETEYLDYSSKWKRIAIRPVYDTKAIANADYNMNLIIIGEPAKRTVNDFFRYMTNVDDKLSTEDILPGNKFTEDVLPDFIEKSAFALSAFDWWIDVQHVYDTDAGYVKDSTNQLLSMSIDDATKYTASYNILAHVLSQPSVAQFMYNGVTIKITSLAYSADSDGLNVIYTVPSDYSFRVAVPFVPDTNMKLVRLSNNIAIIDTVYSVDDTTTDDDRYIRLAIDFDMRQVTVSESYDHGETYTVPRDCEEDWFSFTGVNILYDGSAYITLVLEGIESHNNLDFIDYDYISHGTACIRVKLTNGPYVNIPKNMPASGIGCFYTDTRDRLMDRIQFAELKTDSELQFLRQQWNTDNSTENFWWIDKDSIFELTRDKFILKKRTNELDDWGGDVFSAGADDDGFWWKRSDVIDSRTRKYFCSDAKGTSARFIRVSCNGNNIYLDIFNPLSKDNTQHYDMLDTKQRVLLNLSIHKITENGAYLNNTSRINTSWLNTFSDILPEVLVTHAKWSATCIDNFLIVGIHYDSNMNQWAVVINLSSGNVVRIIQGYGCVGADGSLTGGEIPTKYFDANIGFTGYVQSVESLKKADMLLRSLQELWTVQDRIVGDDTQQWYISKDIKGIVSHLRYTGSGVFEAVELKLNNNYSVDYDSASYVSSALTDTFLNAQAVKDALPINNAVWTGILVSWLYPVIYYFAPKISIMNYLQQTLGQAAYVHYNSASIWQKALSSDSEQIDNSKFDIKQNNISPYTSKVKAVDSSELSFDTQSIRQEQSVNDPYSMLLTICASAIGALKDWAVDNISYDKDADKFKVDIDNNWSDYFEKNINSARLSDNGVQSIYATQTSEITALKTLDMFYSTCDKQHINAGRGYVNHNFVAQCVSQSVERVHTTLLQQKFIFVLKEVTLLPLHILNKALESVKEGISKQVEATGGNNFVIFGMANGATVPVAPGLAIGYLAADVACNYTRIGITLVSELLQALGGGKLQASVTARQTGAPRTTIEHKHRYGSRSESFMWPCFGVDAPQTITDESVTVVMENKPWRLDLPTNAPRKQSAGTQPDFVTQNIPVTLRDEFKGEVPYFVAMVKGEHKDVQLPDKMAYVIGTESFLPPSNYKNRSVGESEPVFPTPPFQDYIIDESWQLAQTASDGMTTWVSCRDTKLIDGDYSNIVVSDDFCGVACPYTAIEVKRGIEKKYIRPWAVTPNAVALNNTGINCMFEEKAYHAFDGYGSRIVNWMGSPGIGKEKQTLQYAFLTNDRFKRSNKLPPNEFMGNFKGEPKVAVHGDMNDSVFSIATQPGENTGVLTGTVGEDKDVRRYALPVFSEFVNTLPAVVKTVSSQTLSIVDGVTSLTTANRDLQTAYKSPVSVDFSIGKNKYRYTYEYICSVENDDATGVTIVTELVPCLGLKFIGSTPYEAYLYSDATRQYYKFTGGTSISSVDTIERFRGVISGRYDFISQEVVLPCVATFDRLDGKVHDDDDETDNVIVPLLKDSGFIGEVPPPLDTIYDKKFRTLSLPSGVAFQGPNRCIINRFVVQDYMIDQIKGNYGKWKRVSRETYHPFREYKAKFHDVEAFIGDDVEVNGWTHNPFLLVTAPLGVAESVDCMFEWEITFCWPVEMDKLYGKDNYAVVNVMAETMTPGGKVIADRPVHIFLTKELFTRSNSYGYYSFRYQSKCGIGNRERLHIWSDQYICISGLQLEYQVMTEKRTEILTQQADVTGLKEI